MAIEDSEQKKSLLLQLVETGHYPQFLYKYRTVKQIKMILENFSFWFAKPDTFNDPFDCSLSEIDKPSLEDARRHFTRIGITPENIEKSINIYRREPEKLSELIREIKEKTIFNKGVLALSETKDDILMWSHYADYHKGVVIGLDIQSDLGFFLTPLRIEYKDTYQELNYLNDPNKSTIDTLRLKSSQWQYEKEIRIYKNSSGLHQIKAAAIQEIYFGVKANDEDIKEITEICTQKDLTHIRFYKASKSHRSFSLYFNQI
ncbi:DUF2971 domain-containing protein [Desulfotignum balticum]|uniref:DUF2971 domain-containing protein n=1 Tax=Desulfotignum balticum TaxID=115781 RepID=UPI000428F2F7|nr:DUF2971 domain-containing protein [Desulfotignum balticum]